MKKIYCSGLIVFLFFAAKTQTFSLDLYKQERLLFHKPVFIGRSGTNYLLMDLPDARGTRVYSFTPSLQLVTEIRIPHGAFYGQYHSKNGRTNIVWQERAQDTTSLLMYSIYENGQAETSKRVAVSVGQNNYTRVLTDKNNGHYLLYNLFTDRQQHLIINGLLLDSLFNTIKKIGVSFNFDTTLDRLAGPLLDTEGNVHMVLYDKLTNYRGSVAMRINTLPRNDGAALEERFHFDRIKLYDLLLYDNPVDKQVQLAGFFYDGSSKHTSGIASIRFPYQRINQVSHTFNRFSLEQRSYLARGMEHVRKRDDVFDYMKMKDILEENGDVLIDAWMIDLPKKRIIKDREQEQFSNNNIYRWIRDDPERIQFRNTPNRVKNDQSLTTDAGNTLWYFNPDPSGNSASATRPVFGAPNSGSRTKKDDKFRNGALLPEPARTGPEKIAFFSMDAKGRFGWMQILPGSIPIHYISRSNNLLNYPLPENGEWHFPYLQEASKASGKDEDITGGLSMLSVGRTGIKQEASPRSVTGDYFFSKPFKLNNGKYLSAYTDIRSGQSGLAVLEMTVVNVSR
jgi:hypothetical protein